MPKIVDHEKQRQLVAEAALRLIKKGGLEHATVRNIAVEAGLSVGSMRHYFSTQADLFAFCMNIFLTRVQNRVESMELGEDVFQGLQAILLQFLPLDADRKMEMEVWLSFHAKALIHPALQSLSARMYEGIQHAIMFVLNTLTEHRLAKENLNTTLEAYKLNALLDGLAMHLITHPHTLSHDMAKQIVSQHLQSLCKVEGGDL